MFAEGLSNAGQFNQRLASVLEEIENGPVQTKVWRTKYKKMEK
jgi:hypothetical protein